MEMTMDQVTLREATEADFARVADLLSATQPEPVTEADLIEWERRKLAGQIRRRCVAGDAATNTVVGLSAVGFFQQTNRAYNMITGVDRAYRGRKIAQALKLLTIRYAKERGAEAIVTNNDSQNAPNAGHQPQARLLTSARHLSRLIKQLAWVGHACGAARDRPANI
jgi:ribosomal protein S18 acetylase RimI-like enzyme